MLASLISLAFSLTLPSIILAQGVDPISDPNVVKYRSRPDFLPSRLYTNTSENEVTPGYIFMAPYQATQNTAVIYDTNGEVVWYGFGSTGSGQYAKPSMAHLECPQQSDLRSQAMPMIFSFALIKAQTIYVGPRVFNIEAIRGARAEFMTRI